MAREIDYRLLTPAALEGCVLAWDHKTLPANPEAAVLWDSWLEMSRTEKQSEIRESRHCSGSKPQIILRQWLVLDNVRAVLAEKVDEQGLLQREREWLNTVCGWIKAPQQAIVGRFQNMSIDGHVIRYAFSPAAVMCEDKPTASTVTLNRWDDHTHTESRAAYRRWENQNRGVSMESQKRGMLRTRMLWTFRKLLPDPKLPTLEIQKQIAALPERLPFPAITQEQLHQRYRSMGE